MSCIGVVRPIQVFDSPDSGTGMTFSWSDASDGGESDANFFSNGDVIRRDWFSLFEKESEGLNRC